MRRYKDAVPYRTIASLSNALASFLFILRFINFLSVLPTIGTTIISFKQIIRDILSFLFLWGLLLLAFSVVMSIVYPAAAYRHYQSVEEYISLSSMQNATDAPSNSVLRQCVVDLYDRVVPEKVQGYLSDGDLIIFFLVT